MLTDAQISTLLAEPKRQIDQVALLRSFARSIPEDSSRQQSVDVVGLETESRFRLILRQSTLDAFNFSVILMYVAPDGRQTNLRRHNGTSHSHYNPIEDSRFSNVFHVHSATERYQRRGSDAEHFAAPTSGFYDLATALAFMLHETGFQPPAQFSMDVSP